MALRRPEITIIEATRAVIIRATVTVSISARAAPALHYDLDRAERPER
jgi:hypothetical protein